MKAKRITVIFYAVAVGIAIGYWAGQENAQVETNLQTVKVGR